jgi:hypothetical protein
MLPVAVMLTFELNVFFLKYALWVPPTNPLNTLRLVLWCGLWGGGCGREGGEGGRGRRGREQAEVSFASAAGPPLWPQSHMPPPFPAPPRFLCALPGAREYWEFIEGRSGTGEAQLARFSKLGTFAWLAIAVGGCVWGGGKRLAPCLAPAWRGARIQAQPACKPPPQPLPRPPLMPRS